MLIGLIGLPGCGKTTVGRQVARRLGLRFVDSDIEIEARLGESVRTFFEREGEARFRDIEEATIAELARETSGVLATGGGAVLRPANRAVLHERSTVVYLRSRPEELARRLRYDTRRPLLQVVDPLRRLRDLYAVRDPLYRETAHYVVNIGRPTLPALVNTLLMQLELAGVLSSPLDATDGADSAATSGRGAD